MIPLLMFLTKNQVYMRKLLTLLAIVLSTTIAYSQTRTIMGKVADQTGKPVPSASVLLKGTKSGVSADADGNFKISAKTGDVLIVSAVNFTSENVKVSNQNNVSVTLSVVETQIDEVIVTAQGIKRKSRDIGYAYAKISNAEINNGRSPQLATSLSGKVSGLAILNVNNSVDPSVKIVLRGYRSLTGNNEALIIVDGMQTTSTVLSLINPNDVENVTILKGGQAATLYGSAGINGAMVVTTKKGSGGKLKVSFSNTTNFEEISFLPKFQDKYGSGSQYYDIPFGAPGYNADPVFRSKLNFRPYENQQFGDAFDGSNRVMGRTLVDGSVYTLPYANVKNSRKNAFDIGVSVNNQVNFQGGDENSSFYVSFENQKINGIVPKDKSDRTSVRANASKKYGKLSALFTTNYSQASYDRTTSDFYFDVINQAANIPLKDLRDWQNNKFANPNGYYNDYYNNPYFNKDNGRQNYKDANIQGTLELNYQATPWLNIMERIGIMNNTRSGKNIVGQFLYTDWAKNSAATTDPTDGLGIYRAITDNLGSVTDYSNTENVLNNEFQLQAKKDIGDFSNSFVAGFSVYQRQTKSLTVGSGSIVVPGLYNVGNRQGELTGGEGNSLQRRYGYYADLTSSYKGWLILNGSFRFDATSLFYKPTRAANQYSYPYYGGSVSFIATDAISGLKSKTLNYAKLRVSYNKNGNDNIGLYGLDPTFPNGNNFPYGNSVGLTVGNTLPDANLKPEFVNSFEVGGEFQLFNNKVSIDAAVYSQNSKGQVINVTIPRTTGFSTLTINVGEVKNWGFETDLKVQLLNTKNFRWDASLRYSMNDNKVVDLYPGITEFQYGGYSYATVNVIKDNPFPYLKTDGYNYAADGSGRRLVSSTTGYPTRDKTLTGRGRTLPKDIIGFSSKASYKNFSLGFTLEYRGGNVMYSDLGRQMTFTGSGKWTENRGNQIFENSAYVDASNKTVANTDVYVREPEYALWVNNYRLISENFVTPAWFIKLRDLNLNYSVPTKLALKTKIFTGANISLFARNLFTIVDKTNFYTDPEFSFTTGNGQGINNTGQTPPVRQYGFNINFTF